MSKITVIEIKKSFRNGQHTELLVIDADGQEDMDDQAREWCENDSSGAVYGWNATWREVDDKPTVLKAIENKIKSIEDGIKYQKKKLARYKEHFKNI